MNVSFPSAITCASRIMAVFFRSLKPGQHYKIGVELTMPTSPINMNVGVFMVKHKRLPMFPLSVCRHPDRASMRCGEVQSRGIGWSFAIPVENLVDHQDVEAPNTDWHHVAYLFAGAKYNPLWKDIEHATVCLTKLSWIHRIENCGTLVYVGLRGQ